MNKEKFLEFYTYVGKVAGLDEEEVKRYALSIGRLQIHTKSDFCSTLEVLRFLVLDKEFKVPKKIKKELNW